MQGSEAAIAIISATNNTNVHVFHLDLSSRRSAVSFASKVEEKFGFVDVLINNAAIAPKKKKLDSNKVEMMFSVNVLGYHNMMVAFQPLLKKSKAAEHHPRIVNGETSHCYYITATTLLLLQHSHNLLDFEFTVCFL